MSTVIEIFTMGLLLVVLLIAMGSLLLAVGLGLGRVSRPLRRRFAGAGTEDDAPPPL